jgi:endonuclease G
MKKTLLLTTLLLTLSSAYNFKALSEEIKAKAVEIAKEKLLHPANTSINNFSFNRKEGKHHLKFPINKLSLFNTQKCSQLVDKKTYLSCYDYDYKISKYEIFNLDGNLVGQGNIRFRLRFYAEPTIPRKYRAYWYDYNHSGYDRGHIRSDGSTDWDIEALKTTYSMVNIWAQTPTLNRKVWSKAEKYSRYVARKLGNVDVLNITVIPNRYKTIGRHKIAVPKAFYKIIYNEDENFRRCFYFENIDYNVEQDRLKQHIVDCDKIYY